ncbi:uncharacterized protein PHALS_00806 [Plasmopara halstedii]|uniref:Uncharacterized protein n=1 Tax=Plasmopara halstedii TaxID=4781 RepID=A0A0P1AT76_PLAHL|nr:uncharacterized protein PHALS_00806 [Plasmopara halstedii]CEG44439.1 hypothetical protein PHALS_00806 [Plasmopara halstedii]|eukprot:XP_024580808.1 hypothetical protein PHALS_00806 [Plasmopara halstedii]
MIDQNFVKNILAVFSPLKQTQCGHHGWDHVPGMYYVLDVLIAEYHHYLDRRCIMVSLGKEVAV